VADHGDGAGGVDLLAAADPVPLSRTRSVDRLTSLAAIVDETARPWREAAA